MRLKLFWFLRIISYFSASNLNRLLEDYSSPILPNSILASFTGHRGNIKCVSFLSTLGSFVLSGSSDNTCRIWHLESAQCVSILSGHQGRIWDVSSNESGTLIATGSGDGTVRLWDSRSVWERLKDLDGLWEDDSRHLERDGFVSGETSYSPEISDDHLNDRDRETLPTHPRRSSTHSSETSEKLSSCVETTGRGRINVRRSSAPQNSPLSISETVNETVKDKARRWEGSSTKSSLSGSRQISLTPNRVDSLGIQVPCLSVLGFRPSLSNTSPISSQSIPNLTGHAPSAFWKATGSTNSRGPLNPLPSRIGGGGIGGTSRMVHESNGLNRGDVYSVKWHPGGVSESEDLSTLTLFFSFVLRV